MLVRTWPKVIVREHGANCAILAGRIDKRIGPPALHRRLCSDEFAFIAGAEHRMRQGLWTIWVRVWSWWPKRRTTVVLANGGDAFAHILRRKRSIFVIPSVARTV